MRPGIWGPPGAEPIPSIYVHEEPIGEEDAGTHNYDALGFDRGDFEGEPGPTISPPMQVHPVRLLWGQQVQGPLSSSVASAVP